MAKRDWRGVAGRIERIVPLLLLAGLGVWLYREYRAAPRLVAGLDGEPALDARSVVRRVAGGAVVFASAPGDPTLPEGAYDGDEFELLVCAPGCGLWRGPADDRPEALPEPVEVTVEVAGAFALPAGLMLDFRAPDESPEVAAMLEHACVRADHWAREGDRSRYTNVWVDPATRTTRALLPRAGAWRIHWTNTGESPPDKDPTLSIAWGMGESDVAHLQDGARFVLTIRPDDLHNGVTGGPAAD